MSSRIDAKAKELDGRLESGFGEVTADPGHQIQDKLKQVQGSAMAAAEDLETGAKSVAETIGGATDKIADNID